MDRTQQELHKLVEAVEKYFEAERTCCGYREYTRDAHTQMWLASQAARAHLEDVKS